MADSRQSANGGAAVLVSLQPRLLVSHQRRRHQVIQSWPPLLLLSLLLSPPVSDALSIIKQLNSCSVETDAGIVDLSPLDSKNGSARFRNILSYSLPQYVQYEWNPCSDFSDGACKLVALCSTAGGEGISYGSQSSAKFSVSGSQLQLAYSNQQYQSVAAVTLLCSNGADAMTSTGDSLANSITFQLSSPHACATSGTGNSTGISTGSVLCIIFFTLVLVYFVGGCVYMKVRHQAIGFELVPNGNLWREVPALVKDGFLCATTMVGLRKRPGYEPK